MKTRTPTATSVPSSFSYRPLHPHHRRHCRHCRLPPEATPAEPNPQLRCTGSACRVLIKCDAVQGSVEPCNIRVDVFVRASALRLEEGGATRTRRRIRFAAAVANVPAGGTANVRLSLTKRGRQIVRANEHRRLRGVMEIRNSVGPVQAVRVRIKLR
jgi:hypothetical protein